MAGSVLERLFTSADAFGVKKATPVQRAICRASDGVRLGELWENPDVREAFGGCLPDWDAPPDMLVILAAIRGGKSMLAAAKALQVSQDCNVGGMSPGDEVLVPVLSVDKSAARKVFTHLVETIQKHAHLRKLMVREPTAESVFLRHPTGRTVEIRVTAMAKHGSTLVGAWLAGCIFDEAPRMNGAEEGVRNLDDAMSAIVGRMRPGAQIWLIGSPYAPFGPVFELNQKWFGKRGPVQVIRGTGPMLNPVWWTPAQIERVKRTDMRAYQTDVLGQFCDAKDQLFPSAIVDAAMREQPEIVTPQHNHHYTAAMDPAMRGNAWTLIILGCSGLNELGHPKYYVALARQWRGNRGDPLEADTVLKEIAATLKPYNVDEVQTDQWSVDALTILAEQQRLTLYENVFNAQTRVEVIERIRIMLEEHRLELPPDRTLRHDLLRISRRVTQSSIAINMPESADGRHCDYAPALGLALKIPPDPPSMDRVWKDQGMARAIAAVDARMNQDAQEGAMRSVFRGGLQ